MFEDLEYNDWLEKNGYQRIPGNKLIILQPFLNIYGYPEEFDYTDLRLMPVNWLRIETFMRKTEEEFKLPEKFVKTALHLN